MRFFIIISGIQSIAFLFVTLQLLLAKPSSLKVMIPLILITITAFILLIAIDLYIEFHLMHKTPKIRYMSDARVTTTTIEPPKDKKKKGKEFKLGFSIIYINMCVVFWFLYYGYKDLEEQFENEENEIQQMEIVISHIT